MKNIFADPPKLDQNGKVKKDNTLKYTLVAFAAPIAIMFLVLYCFDALPFGIGTFTSLRMDLYHQYGPLFAELYERLKNFDSLIYSWTTGLGSGFLGNFFNYLCSPLSLLILLFDHENIPDAISLMMLFNAAFASVTFYYFLRKSTGKTSYVTSAFGVLYAFSGYFVAYYWNVMWLQAMVWFPLVILGVQQIIKSKHFILYTVSLTAIMITNYYMAYMVCLFSVIYFFICYFSRYEFGSLYAKKPKPDQGEFYNIYSTKDKIFHSRLLGSGLVFAIGSVLAACLAAFALLPIYYILQASSATSGTFPGEYNSYFTIFDFLSNHLASVEPTIRSSGDTVLPNIYCGIATLLLAPLYLFTKSISRKEKTAYSVLLLILFFSFNINYLNYIWHGFHFPNDLPYRFSFMYCFVLLFLAYKTVLRLREFSAKTILITGIGLCAFIALAQEIGTDNITEKAVIVSIVFAIIYTAVFISVRSKKYQASAMAVVILCCFVSEIAIANTDNYVMSQSNSSYSSDYESFKILKRRLDDYDGSDTYRMELTNLRTRMDNAWFYYNGVSTFSSMAYEKTSNLMCNLGMYSNYINSYTYYLQTPIFNSMMSLKYIVNNDDETYSMNPFIYNELGISVDKYTAYEYEYPLPIAYCVNNDITDWIYDNRDNPFDVQSDYFERATGVYGVFNALDITADDVYYDNVDEFYSGFDDGEYTFYKTNYGQSGSIVYTFTSENTQSCYLYIKSDSGSLDHSDGETITVETDGRSIDYNGDDEYILDIGVCKAGEEIKVTVPLDSEEDSGYLTVLAYGVNLDVFEDGYLKLYESQLDIDTFDDTYIKGSVDAQNDCILYTSIPYDESWNVTIDGVDANNRIVKIGDALVGVKLSSGSHTVEFEYKARGLVLGSLISLATLILLIVIFILMLKKDEEALAVSSPPVTPANEDDSWSDITPLSSSHTYVDLLGDPPSPKAPTEFDDTRLEEEYIVSHSSEDNFEKIDGVAAFIESAAALAGNDDSTSPDSTSSDSTNSDSISPDSTSSDSISPESISSDSDSGMDIDSSFYLNSDALGEPLAPDADEVFPDESTDALSSNTATTDTAVPKNLSTDTAGQKKPADDGSDSLNPDC